MGEKQWQQAIIEEAQRFCTKYPNNERCHFEPPPAEALPEAPKQ
jgi:hypothetical protein